MAQNRILLGDSAATKQGVVAGMRSVAARALCPALHFLSREIHRETAVLHLLACWSGQFTSRVSLVSDTVLLEVSQSLRLFGGVERLVDEMRSRATTLGVSILMAGAPTPLGAEWLARSGQPVFLSALSAWQEKLALLPIRLLPPQAVLWLQRFGLTTLGEVRRLPVASLKRRVGQACALQLAAAFGEVPDLRADFVFPETFAQTLTLPFPVAQSETLLFTARRLVAALSGWLSVRQLGVSQFALRLGHAQGETLVELKLATLTAELGRFERVMRERFYRLELTLPVESLRLVVADARPLVGQSAALFDDRAAQHGQLTALFERLTARLGDRCLYQIEALDDYRPEYATRRVALMPSTAHGVASASPRPVWLLEKPLPLREIHGRPGFHGELVLVNGPERLESGWWGGKEAQGCGQFETKSTAIADMRRDYFIARTAHGRWLWIYREVKAPGGWFLHGYFS